MNLHILSIVFRILVISCFTWCCWQGLALEGLTAAGVIRSHHFWLDVEHIQEALQNVMVILEMVVFSIVQRYAYSAIPYTGASVDKPKHE